MSSSTTDLVIGDDDAMKVSDDRESAFLAGQTIRRFKLRSNNDLSDNDGGRRDHDEDPRAGSEIEWSMQKQRNNFWLSFKQECLTLHTEMDAMLVGTDDGTDDSRSLAILFVTAAQRNAAFPKLQAILSAIRSLESHCLITSSRHTQKENDSSYEPPMDLRNVSVTDYLPLADLRLVTDEIQKLQVKAERLKLFIIPPKKFTFRRYRALMSQNEKNAPTQSTLLPAIPMNHQFGLPLLLSPRKENSNGAEQIQSNNLKNQQQSVPNVKNGYTLEGKSNCTISIQSHNDDNNIEPVNQTISVVEYHSSKVSSFLLKEIDKCHITLNGDYSSVHLIHVTNTTVCVTFPISGPVHVTDCHNTIIYASSHQLRIHDCTSVTFHIHVIAGPIIENCTNIVFHGDFLHSISHIYSTTTDDEVNKDVQKPTKTLLERQDNYYWDVKDFDWLKLLVKSPNFHVVWDSQTLDSLTSTTRNETENIPLSGVIAKERILEGAANCVLTDNDEDEL